MMEEPAGKKTSNENLLATRKPRVLAVDDQADSLRLLEIRLKSAGMDCVCCRDGSSALELLKKEKFDVIILDVLMPVMDGFEVCRLIKEDENLKDIPVIFLTAQLEYSDRIKGLKVGGHDYLTKPVNQAELIARTDAALRVKYLQDKLKEQLENERKLGELRQKMLDEHWEKTIGQLSASLAHEINNPLAAALGNVQLLMIEHNFKEDTIKRLQAIEESLYRASKKLRSLLLIAHSTGTQELLSLDSLVNDLVTLANYKAIVNKVTIIPNADSGCKWLVDPGEIARACLYILNNAIEAVTGMPNATVAISTAVDGEWHVLKIADNGPGLSDEVKPKLFEAFYTTKGPLHYGVGLYLAKNIITNAGGRIEAVSPAGEYSTEFQIYLPAAKV